MVSIPEQSGDDGSKPSELSIYFFRGINILLYEIKRKGEMKMQYYDFIDWVLLISFILMGINSGIALIERIVSGIIKYLKK